SSGIALNACLGAGSRMPTRRLACLIHLPLNVGWMRVMTNPDLPSDRLKQRFQKIDPPPASPIELDRPDEHLPPYVIKIGNKWRFRPSEDMKKKGFLFITFGPELTKAHIDQAKSINAEWRALRTSGAKPVSVLTDRTLAWGYQKVLA